MEADGGGQGSVMGGSRLGAGISGNGGGSAQAIPMIRVARGVTRVGTMTAFANVRVVAVGAAPCDGVVPATASCLRRRLRQGEGLAVWVASGRNRVPGLDLHR